MFSAWGFYPVSPGSDEYALGSPLVDKAILKLENGNTFTIEAVGQTKKSVYVKKVMLNGRPVNNFTIKHSDITKGGTLTFYMSSKPKK